MECRSNQRVNGGKGDQRMKHQQEDLKSHKNGIPREEGRKRKERRENEEEKQNKNDVSRVGERQRKEREKNFFWVSLSGN